MLLYVILRIIDWILDAYMAILLIRMVLSWVSVLAPRWRPRGVIASLIDIVYRLTDPPLRWLRRYIPPLPLGPVSLDVSFIVLYFVLIVLRTII